MVSYQLFKVSFLSSKVFVMYIQYFPKPSIKRGYYLSFNNNVIRDPYQLSSMTNMRTLNLLAVSLLEVTQIR